jgi:hypothetical protein
MLEVERGGYVLFFNAVSVLVHSAGGPFRRARARAVAQAEFERRSRDEIAAWRTTYGRSVLG